MVWIFSYFAVFGFVCGFGCNNFGGAGWVCLGRRDLVV